MLSTTCSPIIYVVYAAVYADAFSIHKHTFLPFFTPKSSTPDDFFIYFYVSTMQK